ncbi:MAG: Rpn family recombination-promoting nuclease/putative transposase, partial [Bacilli bacterium]|nr:Rpn family recombination-promoting nuclease/putative transposase [Bacilli bacterium]
KNTFDTEDALKKLIKETLNLNVKKIYKNNIELSIDNKKERRKYLDLILETDKGIINVEINHGYKEELPNRNFLYLCKLISASVRKNKSYTNIAKHIQLNITWNLKEYLDFNVEDKKILKFHLSEDKLNEKLYDNIFEIVYINMDYFENVWYHGDIKKENPFLMFLAASTEENMDKISKGDKNMEKLSDKVKKLNQDPDVLDVIIEDEEEIIANSLYEKGIEKGVEKGIEEGINQGIKEGINQGIEKRNVEIVKNMLQMKMDIKDISKATGLSIEAIKKIK